jgi:Skp family chaperone for outer membrane proteins
MPARLIRIGSLVAFLGVSLAGGALGSAFFAGRAQATNTNARPEPATIATFDLNRVVQGLDEANEAKDRLAKLQADFEKEMSDVRAQIKKIDDDLSTMKEGNSGEALRLKAKRVELQATGKARYEGLRQLMDIQDGDMMRTLFTKMQDAAKRLAEQQGYDVVLADDRSTVIPEKDEKGNKLVLTGAEVSNFVVSRRILAANDRLDITAQMVTFMNNEFKAGKK